MKIILWIVCGLFGLFALLWMKAILSTFKRNRKIIKQIEPAMTAVENGDEKASAIVLKYAKDPSTRNYLIEQLVEVGKDNIFPKEYRTIEMIAEADLVRWLMHPNELKTAPDEIELINRLEVQENDNNGICFLFRFRVNSPHWAAEYGWMSGISGPFWNHEPKATSGRETFSELTSYKAMTDDEHLAFLRNAVKKKGLVVPS